ncbi:MAG: arginyltransferase [Planctomycetota bacterium]
MLLPVTSGYVHTGPCVYRPEERWALRMLPAPRDDRRYEELLDASHRRSGWVVYKPVCRSCQACRPIRIPVERFRPSKSQRRVLRRNEDVRLEIGPPEPTREKLDLHNRFVAARFDRGDSRFETLESYEEVFGASPVSTREMRYRLDGRLVGLGLIDLLPNVVSSVYFYFDPEEDRRSLGTFSALQEVELAKTTGRGFVYLGYYIDGCREMSYKARFRPCELLHPDGVWRDFAPPPLPLPRAT